MLPFVQPILKLDDTLAVVVLSLLPAPTVLLNYLPQVAYVIVTVVDTVCLPTFTGVGVAALANATAHSKTSLSKRIVVGLFPETYITQFACSAPLTKTACTAPFAQ